MKNTKIIIALVTLLITSASFAQSPLPVGKAQVNLGVGLSGWGIPVYAGFDVSVAKDFTLGAEFSYRSYRENWKDYYYNHNIMGFSGNVNYHFNSLLGIPQNWDFYAGANIGFYVWTSSNDYYGNHKNGLGIGGQIGGRYYFSNKFGINLEFGGGNAFYGGKFGLTIKL